MKNHFFTFGVVLAVALTSCKKPAPTAAAQKGPIDACSLITKDEIQKVQESPVTEAKSSEASDGSFRIGQCFYTTETFSKSVTLAITQRDNASEKGRDPKAFWKETFTKYLEHPVEKEGDEEKRKSLKENDEDEGKARPKKIKGVGDDAWWSANRVGGALYVLKDNVFIRISVGGPDPEDVRIEKTKELALKAVSRL